MKKNIIDITNKNEFLKKIYPNGLSDIKLGRINLYFENKIEFSIYTNQKPAFSPDKWGVFGKNYTTVVLFFSGHFLKNIQIHNWQNNKLENCDVEIIEKNENLEQKKVYCIKIIGKDWNVLLELEDIIFQSSSVYIDETYMN
jgi:hypothetical protein